jgi:transposase
MARRYARALGGSRAPAAVPKNWRDTLTLIGALGIAGPTAMLSVRGSVDREVFLLYVREVLAPHLRGGDVVVLDNLSVHKSAEVRRLIEARGARLLYLPRYSPDLAPIELCWSKLKTALRTVAARSYEALDAALTAVLHTITGRDARNWFRHCGYAL